MLEDAVRRTARWCQANFPPRVEVVVSVVGEIDDETLGFVAPTNDEKTKVELLVSADQSVREAIETTIHAWAHVHTLPWLADWQNDHEDWFWIVFGRMYCLAQVEVFPGEKISTFVATMSLMLQRPSLLPSHRGFTRAGVKMALLISMRSETVLRPYSGDLQAGFGRQTGRNGSRQGCAAISPFLTPRASPALRP